MRMRQFSLAQITSVAANATSANVLSGTRLAPVISGGTIQLWAVAAASGITAKLLIQSDEVFSDFVISDANRYPEMDKDGVCQFVRVHPNDQSQLTFSNSTAGAINVTWKITFIPGGHGRM